MNFNNNFNPLRKEAGTSSQQDLAINNSDDDLEQPQRSLDSQDIDQLQRSLDASMIEDTEEQPELDNGPMISPEKLLYSSKLRTKKSTGLLPLVNVKGEVRNDSRILITFQDMPKSTSQVPETIHYEPTCGIPLMHGLAGMDLQSKVAALKNNDYLTKFEAYRKARQSLEFVPYGKPIDLETVCFDDKNNVEESRSLSPQYDTTNFVSGNKRNKADNQFPSDDYFGKTTIALKYIPEKEVEETKPSRRNDNGKSSKSQNNNLNTIRKGRAEAIMQQSKIQNGLKQKEEDKQGAFESTLQDDNSNGLDFHPDVEVTQPKNSPPKNCVPGLAKRQIHSQGFNETSRSSKPNNFRRHQKNSNLRIPERNPFKVDEDKFQEKVACPICQLTFPLDRIEGHAANCGFEEPSTQHSTRFNGTSTGSSNYQWNTVKCQLCNELVLKSEYEDHIARCGFR